MKNEESSGGIVINDGKVVVVYQKNNNIWVLPKGHIEKGESILETAKREVYEEIGIKNLNFIKELGSYKRKTKRDVDVIKKINFLLFSTNQLHLEPKDRVILEAKWIDIDKVSEVLSYKEDKEFFEKIKGKIKIE